VPAAANTTICQNRWPALLTLVLFNPKIRCPLTRKFPEATDRVQVATVQAMIRRIFDDPDTTRPTPGTYDLIIVDEAHRGYTLDAELRARRDLGGTAHRETRRDRGVRAEEHLLAQATAPFTTA